MTYHYSLELFLNHDHDFTALESLGELYPMTYHLFPRAFLKS